MQYTLTMNAFLMIHDIILVCHIIAIMTYKVCMCLNDFACYG